MNLNPSHKKRKWTAWGAPRESVNQNMKKPAPTPPRSHTIGPVEPCGKYGRPNHTVLNVKWGPTSVCSVVA